jgi:fucose 4-O-acetylase-like acetyltransferase
MVASISSRNLHYDFVDFIRLLGIAGIVWAHVPIFAPQDFTPLRFDYYFLYFPFMLIWKFGVINFFMITGFLIKGKLDANPYTYLKKRLRTISRPYLFALTLFALLYGYHVVGQLAPNTSLVTSIYHVINKVVLSTSFWFIPSYFISLTILVLTRKYIKSMYYGLILFFITLVIGITSTYFPLIAIPHLDIAFGYLFFLWLGYTLNDKLLIDKIMLKSNFIPLLILAVSCLGLSCLESYQLCIDKFPTYFNILRLSNIAYSIAMFMLMMHFFNHVQISNILLKLKSNSFELYLYHPIFAWVIAPKAGLIIQSFFGIKIFKYSFMHFSMVFIFTYLLIFLASYILVRALERYKILSWDLKLVGRL